MHVDRRDLSHTARAAALWIALLSFVAAMCVSVCVAAPAAQTPLKSGKALLEQGKLAEAKQRLTEAVAREPANSEAYEALGRAHLRSGDFDKAIECAKRAVALADSVPACHLLLAQGYGVKAMRSNPVTALGAARSAKREWERTIVLDPQNVEARSDLVDFHTAAPGVAGGSLAEAERQAAVLERLHPLSGAYAWAKIWDKRKQADKVEASLRRAVPLDTSSTSDARNVLGLFLQNEKRYAVAESLYQAMLAERPGDLGATYQLGRACLLAGVHLDRAQQCFERYLESPPPPNNPSHAGAHWRLGMVLDRKGDRLAAIAEVRKAVEMDPKDKEIRATLKELERKK